MVLDLLVGGGRADHWIDGETKCGRHRVLGPASMSLTVLVIVVFCGISLVVAVVHMSGGSVRATIESEPAAIRRLADDYEEESVRDVHITRDRHSAILLLDSGMIGIVHSVGDMLLTRCLWPSEIGRIDRPAETQIVLGLKDISWPGGTFEFEDRNACESVIECLQATENTTEEIS